MLIHSPLIPVVLFSGALFGIGFLSSRRIPFSYFILFLAVVIAIPGLLFVLYYLHLFDSAAWFYEFRAVPFSEFTAAGLGLLPGLVWGWSRPETAFGKLVVPAITLLLVVVPYLKMFDRVDAAKLKDSCDGEVCMQSTPSTCGPASAATLLKASGVDASERELASEAYTSRSGTEIWYLMRALRRRGFDSKVVIQSTDSKPLPSPAIAGVILSGGAGHFIAILNSSSANTTIADPLKGKLVVDNKDLRYTYHFTGFFLVVRRK